MKKMISLLLALLITVLSLSAAAAADDSGYLIGDADRDGEITILDATRIQRRLAGLAPSDRLADYLSDVDGDRSLSILDATCIQRRLASIDNMFHKEKLIPWKADITLVNTNVNDSTVQVGTTVTFTVAEKVHEIPSEYEFYVDGIMIGERTEHCVFQYTFEQEGSYRISVVAYDPFGGMDVYTLEFTAILHSQPLIITYAAYNRNTKKLTAQASGGTAPYEYQYTIRNNIEPPPPDNPPAYTANFVLKQDDEGNWILQCPYCSDSVIDIPTFMLTPTLSYYCEVQVRGADGTVSEIKKVQIIL